MSTEEGKRILLVANQTAGGEALRKEVQRRIDQEPCRFTLLVPATPPKEHAVWSDEEAYELARKRLEVALQGLRATGAEVDGQIGDENPLEAIADVLRKERFDEIILSTLPPGASKWLKRDLPTRAAQRFNVPITHVVGGPDISVPS